MLQYYQKNSREAFYSGFTCKLHYEVIDSEVYEVHKYYFPRDASNRIRWVRKYFQKLDSKDIPLMYKRRKSWVEYAELALLILNRIHNLTSRNCVIFAGSKCVSPIAWAIFGPSGGMAQMQFAGIVDIANYYKKQYLDSEQCYPVDIHFKKGSNWAPKIASSFERIPLNSPNFWMTVALLLTYDLIHNCGPDCHEFFELFTNDYRVGSDDFNLEEWEELRCQILGVPGRVRIPHMKGIVKRREYVQQPLIIEEEKKPYRSQIKIELLFEGKELVAGEKTYPAKRPVYVYSNSSNSTVIDFTDGIEGCSPPYSVDHIPVCRRVSMKLAPRMIPTRHGYMPAREFLDAATGIIPLDNFDPT
jgi:hypothetical protein